MNTSQTELLSVYDAAEQAANGENESIWKACCAIWDKYEIFVCPGMVGCRYINPCLKAIHLMSPEEKAALCIRV